MQSTVEGARKYLDRHFPGNEIEIGELCGEGAEHNVFTVISNAPVRQVVKLPNGNVLSTRDGRNIEKHYSLAMPLLRGYIVPTDITIKPEDPSKYYLIQPNIGSSEALTPAHLTDGDIKRMWSEILQQNQILMSLRDGGTLDFFGKEGVEASFRGELVASNVRVLSATKPGESPRLFLPDVDIYNPDSTSVLWGPLVTATTGFLTRILLERFK